MYLHERRLFVLVLGEQLSRRALLRAADDDDLAAPGGQHSLQAALLDACLVLSLRLS